MGVEKTGEPVTISLKPSIGMQHVIALPLVCSLGASRVYPGSKIVWPSGVRSKNARKLFDISVSVHYDEGLVAEVRLIPYEGADAGVAATSIEACVDAWAIAIAAGRAQAGPLAPVLSEVFDNLWLMGTTVVCTYPNGREYMRGFLAAIDVWCRVTVLDAEGREVEIAPEQGGIHPA